MDRVQVFELIDSERSYQDSLSPDRTDGHQHSVGEELVLMDVYLRRALDAWVDNAGDASALNEIRKVAAIAVRCIENHGAPNRALTHR